jgi:hypothetical protein
MKTISELNDKWWYRLLKVTYILSILLALVINIVIIFDQNGPFFDPKKSYITCVDGRRFDLDNYDRLFIDHLDTIDRNNFQAWCTTEATIDSDGDVKLKKLDSYGSDIKQYNFHPHYENRDWIAVITFILIALAMVFGVAEILRRIFYYIVLGSIRPKKKHESDTLLS